MANSPNATPMTVSAGTTPKIGPAVIPINLPLNQASSYALDLRGIQQLGFVDQLQSIYVDNSGNAQPLQIIVSSTNQSLIVPGYAQAFLPIFVSNNLVLTFVSTGGVVVPVYPLNFPIAAAVWSVGGGGQVINGKLQVQDAALEAAITNGYLQSQSSKTGSGGTQYPDWIGNNIATGVITATTGALITGNPGYYLTSIDLGLSNDAALAAGELNIAITDSTYGTIWQQTVELPATGGTSLGLQKFSSNAGFVWNNKATNTTCSIKLSASLTAGKLTYNLNYGITPVVG